MLIGTCLYIFFHCGRHAHGVVTGSISSSQILGSKTASGDEEPKSDMPVVAPSTLQVDMAAMQEGFARDFSDLSTALKSLEDKMTSMHSYTLVKVGNFEEQIKDLQNGLVCRTAEEVQSHVNVTEDRKCGGVTC